MESDALNLLMAFARRLYCRWREADPAAVDSQRQYLELEEAFRRRHRETPELWREVVGLLDAWTAQAEYRAELYLCLGLQLGLELGRVNVLKEWDR